MNFLYRRVEVDYDEAAKIFEACGLDPWMSAHNALGVPEFSAHITPYNARSFGQRLRQWCGAEKVRRGHSPYPQWEEVEETPV